ncbi:MAG TPA: long-chain fatty acid--CoA ligase [Longimicrobium sp.]|jgi:long-chain acyl-CoA synthetase
MPATPAFRAQHTPVPLGPVERDTIPRLFLGGVDRFAHPAALRRKVDGAWREWPAREVEAQAARLAAALELAGVGPGDRVALLSENRPEWAITDFAVTGMGAIDVPIYPTLPAAQIAYILRDCGARAIMVSTRAQLAKIQGIRSGLPDLRLVVAFDDPAETPDVRRWEEVQEEGRRLVEEGRAGSFRERALAVGRDEVATLIYTSGTTGDPKGVMLTHFNLCSNVAGSQQHGLSDVILSGDRTLSFLPLSHVFERMVDYLYWDVGASISYAESFEKVVDNMGEVAPNIAVAVPRLFEKIYSRVTGATGIKKALVGWALGVGTRVADLRLAGAQPSGALAIQYRLADRLVFSKLRARTGGRVRNFVSGGAPLSEDVAKFFFAAGLPVYEGYGLTETSPVIAVNKPGKVKLGTVGAIIPGVEVAIAEETGEILTRGPHVMKGYWNRPDATAEAIGADGWFHTGDIGEITPDGFLRITDRLKNIIVTAGGKNVAPQPMENVALLSPFVAQIVMLGDRRPFTTFLIVPEWETLEPWAAQQSIPGDRATLCADRRVTELLERETIGRLKGFARYEIPKRVLLIHEEFTIDAGLLTPKLSIKRKAVEQRYRAQIEELYSGHTVE